MGDDRTSYTTREADYKGGCYRRNVIDQQINARLSTVENSIATSVDATPNKLQLAVSSSPLALAAGVYNDIAGCAITLTRAGTYHVIGCFSFLGSGVGDAGVQGVGKLLFGGVAQTATAVFSPLIIAGGGVTGSPVTGSATVSQQWLIISKQANVLVKLQAQKNAGTGASVVSATLSALLVSV